LKNIYPLLFLFGVSIQLSAQIYTIETLPNPMDIENSYVSDPTDILTINEKEELNRTIAFIEDTSTIEIAIVIIPSIGSYDPKEFTYELFNKWGIGKADKDNGLLILTVLDQRRTEFEPGYGLEAVLPDIICYRIGKQLVPYFKNKEYGKGLKITLDAIADVVLKKENVAYVKSDSKEANYIINRRNRAKETPLGLQLLYLYIFINLLFHLTYFFLIYRIKKSKEEYYDRYKSALKMKWYVPFFFFPLPYLFVFFWIKKYIKELRFSPRFAKDSGKPMRLLDETEEDPYLAKGQITEEDIGSVDYDVWVDEDNTEVLILRYDRLFSKYTPCTSCNYNTYYKSNSSIIKEATEHSTGIWEECFRCKNCNLKYSKQEVIPKITVSNDDDDDYSSSRYKRSRSSRSSSKSSRSRRSFGGGKSGGAGAGVNW